MTKNQAINELRSILANLYEDLDDSKRIAHSAELNLAIIKFGGSATNNWYNIIAEAEKSNKIAALLKAMK